MRKISVFVLLSFLCFIFCTKDATTEPENNPGNHAPVITIMTAVPAVLNINMAGQVDSAVVTVIVTDIDDTSLTYTFNADLGNFYAQNGNEIKYTPSAEQGDYIVSCRVSDGQDTVARSVTVSVSQPDPEYEFAPETILINRHLTVLVGPSWAPEWRETTYLNDLVTIEPYRIAKYELTNIEYYQFVKDGGYDNASWWSEAGWNTKIDSGWIGPMYWGSSEPPWLDDPYSHYEETPVHGISFYESEAYCNWLSEKTGIKYSIPNTAQWERAAKGFDPGYKYPWGNEFVYEYIHFISFNWPELLPVNILPEGKSQDGCYNMVGNAFELADPLKILLNDKLVKVYYSEGGGCSDSNDWKRTLTTASAWVFSAYRRSYGVGLRICREY